MNILKRIGIMLSLSMALISPALAQKAPTASIILVDFDRVLRESLVGKDVTAQLDARAQDLQRYGQDVNQKLAQEENELKGKQAVLSSEDMQQQVQAFAQRAQLEKEKAERYYAQIQQGRQRADTEIERVLRPIVTTIMEERGGTMVLNKRFVYHHASGVDVTTEVIERLNGAKPSFDLALPQIQ